MFSHRSPPIGEASKPLTKSQAITVMQYTLGLPDREAAEKLFEELFGGSIGEVLPQVLGTSLFFYEGF